MYFAYANYSKKIPVLERVIQESTKHG